MAAVRIQAESLWLHLGIIKELAAMCHSVFQGGDVRYGFTTVPTYPRLAPSMLSCSQCPTSRQAFIMHSCHSIYRTVCTVRKHVPIND